LDLYDFAYAVLDGAEALTPVDEIVVGLARARDVSGRVGVGALGKAFSVDGTTAAVLMLSRDEDGELVSDCAIAASVADGWEVLGVVGGGWTTSFLARNGAAEERQLRELVRGGATENEDGTIVRRVVVAGVANGDVELTSDGVAVPSRSETVDGVFVVCGVVEPGGDTAIRAVQPATQDL
jgi:hypothetical protein